VIGGNKEAIPALKALPSRLCFVNRLERGTSAEVVCNFLQPGDVSVFSCFPVSHRQPSLHQDEGEYEAPRFTSMRFCISLCDSDKMLCSGL